MNQNKGLFVTVIVLAATLAGVSDASAQRATGTSGRAATRRPNIVLILADDMGVCDVSMYSCKSIPTPNIDSIAKNGVKFTNAYVTSPVCSPSRAGLLTGRYQHRFGFEFNAGALQRALTNKEMGLPTTEITVAQMLKSSGYATGMVGKWHLGMHEKFHPTQRGFDEYFGFLFGANTYIDPKSPGVMTATVEGEGAFVWPRSAQNPVLRNLLPVIENEYLTEAFAREATSYIERHKGESFFLYAPFNAPHTPLQATAKYLDRFPNIKDEKRRIYAAMVSALDDAVGAILNTLRENGLEKDTLVVFASDNGCATYTGACTNDPLRYGKLTHLEGGFRVPFAMQYPGKLKAGMTEDRTVSTLDLFPTFAALSEAKMLADRPYDGVNLMPYLTGQKRGTLHDVLCWRNGSNAAVRKGNWKLFKGGDQYWLFDLSKDVGEHTNLASQFPKIVEALKKELATWEAKMKEPLWPCRKPGGDWEVDGVKLDICV
ncbi:MAG: sulfatase-like hydrolase/transferase [Acidobacteriota bacterium]